MKHNGNLYAGSRLWIDESGLWHIRGVMGKTYRVEERLGAHRHVTERVLVLQTVLFESELQRDRRAAWRGAHGNRRKPPAEGYVLPPKPDDPRQVPCLIDRKTGTLFNPETGECLSTPQLKVLNPDAR